MATENDAHILVVGVGGLGTQMVLEALRRDVRTSVLVRDEGKLARRLDHGSLARLAHIIEGDGTDPEALDIATRDDVTAVLSGGGADPDLALALARAVERNGAGKLCWPAGSTNVMAEDGVTPNYRTLLELGAWVEDAYRAHQACIDAIRGVGVDHVIFCPGRMGPRGAISDDVGSSVRIDRDAGPFVSYEDAAWVMLEAALSEDYDRRLVSAATRD